MKTPKALLTTLLSATLALAPISVSANTVATPAPNTINFPMPDVKDVAKKIAKVGRVNAVQFAVGRLFDGIDWVMDPANNRIIIKGNMYCHQASECVKNEQEAEEHALNSSFIFVKHWKYPFLGCRIEGVNLGIVCTFQKDGDIRRIRYIRYGQKTMSYDQIAQEILNNAAQGHLESIKFVQEVAEEKAREEAEAKAKEREKEEEEDKKRKCLPVTEPNIRMVLEPTTELTIQPRVSLSKIKGMVAWIENGGATSMDPIRVYENYIIVNGNHRFISMKLCHMEAPRTSWAIGSADKRDAYPIKNVKIDKSWHGD